QSAFSQLCSERAPSACAAQQPPDSAAEAGGGPALVQRMQPDAAAATREESATCAAPSCAPLDAVSCSAGQLRRCARAADGCGVWQTLQRCAGDCDGSGTRCQDGLSGDGDRDGAVPDEPATPDAAIPDAGTKDPTQVVGKTVPLAVMV